MEKATGGEFAPQPMAWGKMVTIGGKLSCIKTHKSKTYIRAAFLNTKFSPVRTVYVDAIGKPIDKALVNPWKKKKKSNPVTVRDYTLTNIKRFNVNGEKFVLV